MSNINKGIRLAEYAVRGKIVQRAANIKNLIKTDPSSFPFKEIIECNIGNPHALNQKPISYYRQVLALITYPPLLDQKDALDAAGIPNDVVRRAKEIISKIGSWQRTGAYTESQGYKFVREDVAWGLGKRDGIRADPDSIYLTDGASPGIKLVLNALISDHSDGILIPIPQYPLYSASLTVLGGAQVPYYLNESAGWSLSPEELESAIQKAKNEGIIPRALVVINPGNPTGQVLSREVMEKVCEIAVKHDLVLLADEVYQENIYRPNDVFISFRKVVEERFSKLPLASFHSISKGMIGECGRRGGFMQLTNFPKEISDIFLKCQSMSLCPNTSGQICVGLMMKPPQPGEESYDLFKKEYNTLFEDLKKKATLLADGLNKIPHISTNPVEGAMYAFPSIELPTGFVEQAKREGVAPDEKWATILLENHGVLVVPGSGFKQVEGTYHFRTTILPPIELMDTVISSINKHHENIWASQP